LRTPHALDLADRSQNRPVEPEARGGLLVEGEVVGGEAAIAAGEGATELVVADQLTSPPTITMIRNSSAAVPIRAARAPYRASRTRAAAEPTVIETAILWRGRRPG
jgi:hypothetical protein